MYVIYNPETKKFRSIRSRYFWDTDINNAAIFRNETAAKKKIDTCRDGSKTLPIHVILVVPEPGN